MAVRIGCSGWSYRHWRGVLYPRTGSTSRWLELYTSEFDTVEVNATFYRLPTQKAVTRWIETVPEGFTFAVKVSRYLTHVRRLRGVEQGLTLLGERIAPMRVAGALGPLLWQLPARFTRDDERLASALALLREGRHAFEFRHPSWFHEDVYALLREHSAALVVADRAPEPTSPWIDTTGWWYVRLHHGRGRNGAYTHAELGAGASSSHARAATSTCTSTTTGKASRCGTRGCSQSFSPPTSRSPTRATSPPHRPSRPGSQRGARRPDAARTS